MTSATVATAHPEPATAPPVRRRTRRRRAGVVTAFAAVGLLVLTGCMRIDMEFTLSEEDTASGAIVMALSDEFAESVGMDPQDLWDSMNEGEDSLTDDLPEGSSEEPYAEDGYTGTRITYADQPIESMSSGTDELSITREGDDYVVEGLMDMSDATEGAEGMDEVPSDMLEGFEIRIAVTFPGEIGETNGEVDGTTVSWEPQIGESTEIFARGSAVAGGAAEEETEEPADEATDDTADDPAAEDGTDDSGQMDDSTDTSAVDDGDSGFPWWIVGLVLGVAILGGVVALVVRNNRGPRAPSSNPDDLFGPGPRADYGQPQTPAPPVIPPQHGPADPYQPPADPNSTPHDPR